MTNAVIRTREQALVTSQQFGPVVSLVLDGLTSEHSRRAHERALTDFLTWWSAQGKPPMSKAVVQRHRRELQDAELAIQHGYQMAIQGIGDRAVRELLNIYDKTFKENPEKKDLRWRIEHCQVIHPDDLPRFSSLGVVASIRGVFATSDGPWVVKRLGEERARERGYLYRTLMQSGAVVINGTDPPVEDIGPVADFYCSVT